jgi:cytochrome P450
VRRRCYPLDVSRFFDQVPRQLRLRASIDAPHLPSRHPLGLLPDFRDDPLRVLERLAAVGDLVHFRVLWMNAFFVNSPEAVKRILVDNADAYGKQTYAYDKLRVFIGNGLVTSEGEYWRRQRRIAQPAFHRRRLQDFGRTMSRMAEDMARTWEDKARRGEVVDVAHEMTRLTLRIVASTVLSIDVLDEGRIEDDVTELLDFFTDTVTRVVPVHEILPTPRHRAHLRARTRLDSMIYDLIRRRRRTGEDREDLASMFMRTEDADTGERMSDAQLRDEIMTMFIAGHETTSNLLSWTWWLLSRHEGPLARLHRELDEVLPGGRAAEVDDLGTLAWTGQVLEESLRVRPPVPAMERSVMLDDVIDGYTLPAGTIVFFSQWTMHRHPHHWTDPDQFDPDRFAPGVGADRHRYAFFPFSGGARMCIGDAFARMEAKLVLATLARRFVLEPLPHVTAEPELGITLRIKGGLPCRIRVR